MKIIHVVLGKADPDRMNGVNKVAHQLTTHLAQAGHDVTLWGLTNMAGEVTTRPYAVTLFRQGAGSFLLNRALKQEIAALPVDSVVHFHGVLIPAFLPMAMALHRRGVPWVVTPHGALQKASLKRNRLIKAVYLQLCDRFFLEQASKIHAITTEEKDTLPRFKKLQDIIVIPNACDNVDVSRRPDGDIPVFGYMGRFDRVHKGLDILLEGFRLFVQRGGRGKLCLIGDGPDRSFVQKFVMQHDMQAHVVFCGVLYGTEKSALLGMLDMFLHPSRWDVLPTGALEAAAHAVPLLVSSGIGFDQVIATWQSGIVLEKNQPDALARALVQAENDHYSGALRHKGAKAREMVLHEFNWPETARKVAAGLYQIETHESGF